MSKSRNFIVVEKFLSLARTMENGGRKAESSYREFMDWPREDKEELMFRTDEHFAEEKRAFIEVNNRIVCGSLSEEPPENVLMLLPFCLQHRSCPRQVAWNIDNCRNCGRCAIGGLREIAQKYRMELRVAIRSRFAPVFVEEIAPDLVVAVACEHELMSGLLRIYPTRCFAIILARPEGPCKNTIVELEKVESQCGTLLDGVRAGKG